MDPGQGFVEENNKRKQAIEKVTIAHLALEYLASNISCEQCNKRFILIIIFSQIWRRFSQHQILLGQSEARQPLLLRLLSRAANHRRRRKTGKKEKLAFRCMISHHSNMALEDWGTCPSTELAIDSVSFLNHRVLWKCTIITNPKLSLIKSTKFIKHAAQKKKSLSTCLLKSKVKLGLRLYWALGQWAWCCQFEEEGFQIRNK